MKKIVRYILNYDPTTATNEQRDKLCSYIAAFSLYHLDKKGLYDFSDVLSITNHLKNASCYYIEGDTIREVQMCNEYLRSSKHFVEHLVALAHETCHYAQRHEKNKDFSYKKSFTLSYYNPLHFHEMEYAIIQKYFPHIADKVNKKEDLTPLANIDHKFNELHLYLLSYYSLQKIEYEAYLFGVNVIKDLINIGDTLQLNQKEKITLEIYKVFINQLHDQTTAFIKVFEQLRESKDTYETVKKYINGISTFFFIENPDFFSQLRNANNKSEILSDNLNMLIQTLEISYDDKLAHMLFKNIATSSLTVKKHDLLLNLFTFTDIVLNDSEQIALMDSLEVYNKISHKNIFYEDIIKDKYKLSLEKHEYKPKR